MDHHPTTTVETPAADINHPLRPIIRKLAVVWLAIIAGLLAAVSFQPQQRR